MMSRILVLAASHLTPALAFGAVPACVDMDAPSFSAVMEQLAAQVPFFRPEDYPTCASAAGVCRCVPTGMWIFTRQQARNETLVDKVRSIAVAKGIDVSVLKYNNQTTCLS